MEPTEPNPIVPETPQPKPRNLRLLLGIATAVIVLLAVILAFLVAHSHTKNPQKTTSVTDVDLIADHASINTAKLPPAQKVFYSMMQRTATQSVIAGTYAEGYYGGDANPTGITESNYEERALSWKNGSITANYAELPWDVSQPIYGLNRCLNGARSSYFSYTAASGWIADQASAGEILCKTSKLIEGGRTNIDGLLAGGLSKNQATVWVDLLADYKDSSNGTPLFSFGNPTVTTLDGKQVVSITFKVNAIKTTDCDFKCGTPLLAQSLKKERVDIVKLGYSDSFSNNALSGTFYIDPATVLPVQSSITAYDDKGNAITEYRRTYSFSTPDFQSLSTSLPAAQPALIADFKDVPDSLPAPTAQ